MARRRNNPSSNTGMLILLGGGAAAIWYLMNYGPNGAVSAGAVSYWNTWFGGATTTAPVTTVAAPAPVNTIQNPTVPTPVVTAAPAPVMTPPIQVVSTTPTPVTPAASSGLSVPPGLVIPSNLVVSPNINNSLSGNVQWNGQTVNLTIIPTQASAGVGLIWNTSGQDITSQFSPAQQAALVSAYQSATQNPTSGLGIIMEASPFITPAYNGVREPYSLGLAGLGSLGRIARRKGWGNFSGLTGLQTGRYIQ